MRKNRQDALENDRQRKLLAIADLEDQIEQKRVENAKKYEALLMQKDEEERRYAERQAQMMEDHAIELERRMND